MTLCFISTDAMISLSVLDGTSVNEGDTIMVCANLDGGQLATTITMDFSAMDVDIISELLPCSLSVSREFNVTFSNLDMPYTHVFFWMFVMLPQDCSCL